MNANDRWCMEQYHHMKDSLFWGFIFIIIVLMIMAVCGCEMVAQARPVVLKQSKDEIIARWEKNADEDRKLEDLNLDDFRDIYIFQIKFTKRAIIYRESKLKSQVSEYEPKKDRKKHFMGYSWTVWDPIVGDSSHRETFTAWFTFQDEDDGGNSYGWIENSKGVPVAIINDSDIGVLDGPFYDKDGNFRRDE